MIVPTTGEPQTVRIYTPETGAEALRGAFASLLNGFSQARELAWRLFLRDTRAEHRQSLLGYFWLLVPAVANTLTWVFLQSQNVVHIESGTVRYPLFVLTGTILWGAFNGSVMAMLGVISSSRGMLAKINFPHEALVFSACLKSLTEAFLSALFLIPALFIFNGSWQASILLFPLAMLGTLVVGWALGLALLPVAALYGDVSRAVQLVLRFGFFLAPVVFGLPTDQPARTVMLLNPVTPMIVTGRGWLTGSHEVLVGAFATYFIGAAILFVIALVAFKVALPHLIERLSG